MLANRMALKNAAAGLPLGGAKSGLKADPDAPGFEEKYRRFVSLAKPYLHENGGIFGGFGFDIGARPIHPTWACDELKSTRSFTGKPLDMGGTDYDKEGVAGLGVAVAARTVLETEGKTSKGASFAVQGIGAMGAAVIRYFSQFGGVLKAVGDPRLGGSWFFEDGAPQELIDLISHGEADKAKEFLIDRSYKNLQQVDEVLYAEVDVLLPSAVQNVIIADNVDKIKAKYVVEGANGPCTDEARTKMFDKGIIVIPDFIANPGGVIAAYVELTSTATLEDNLKNRTKVKEAKQLTEEKISDNVRQILKIVHELKVEPVQAGMYLALKKIFKA
jgi:glutamate dehydrogenase/leucine dehydrogenase